LKSKNSFWIFFVVLLCLHAILVLRIDFFPFADVPSHLAEGSIYRYYNEASNQFNKYYTLNYLFYPNTFHLLFFSLPVFPDVEIANKVLHLILVITLPVLVLLVIRELQGNKWFAIIAFILVYNYNLSFGFTGNAIANNTILLILWLWLRTTNKRSNYVANMIMISLLLLLVYFSHAMVALFCMLMVGCFLLYRYRNDFKALVLNSFTLVPLGGLIVYWWFFLQKSAENSTGYTADETSTGAFMKEYYKHEFLQTFLIRAKFIVADNAQLFNGPLGKIVALLLAVIILVPFIIIGYKYATGKNDAQRQSLYPIIDDKLVYIFILLGVSLFCYFLLPQRIPGQEPLYERFSTILLFALIFIGSKAPQVDNKVFAYAAILVAFVHLVLWGQYFIQFDRENKGFSEVLPKDNTKVLSYMNYDPYYRGRMIYDHFQNYFIVRNQGISTTRIIDYRFGMIRRKESGGLPYQGYMYYNESPRKIMQKSDYLLVRGDISAKDQKLLDSLHTFREVKKVNKWHLLKKQ
jgi:hypothetical protein